MRIKCTDKKFKILILRANLEISQFLKNINSNREKLDLFRKNLKILIQLEKICNYFEFFINIDQNRAFFWLFRAMGGLGNPPPLLFGICFCWKLMGSSLTGKFKYRPIDQIFDIYRNFTKIVTKYRKCWWGLVVGLFHSLPSSKSMTL